MWGLKVKVGYTPRRKSLTWCYVSLFWDVLYFMSSCFASQMQESCTAVLQQTCVNCNLSGFRISLILPLVNFYSNLIILFHLISIKAWVAVKRGGGSRSRWPRGYQSLCRGRQSISGHGDTSVNYYYRMTTPNSWPSNSDKWSTFGAGRQAWKLNMETCILS